MQKYTLSNTAYDKFKSYPTLHQYYKMSYNDLIQTHAKFIKFNKILRIKKDL